MRGLRLFVRPIDPSDRPQVAAFLARETDGATAPACGLLGKLLGDIVAVVALDITEDAVVVDDMVVARELRKKWIGRVMIREAELLAAQLDRRRLVVENAGDAHEFFRRVGF